MRGVMRAHSKPGSFRCAVTFAVMAVLLGMAIVPSLAAQDYDGDEETAWAYAMAHEFMSPYCPGRTLAACSSPQAAELRQWIVLQAVAGSSREEVEQVLYEKFGDVIRSSPRPEGWGLAAHLLPYAALVLGAGLVFVVLRRITRPAAPSPAAPVEWANARKPPVDRDLEELLDEELRARDI
jgi:cytochrome c-type biogenesis protein CcmH/NrfF